MAQPLRKSPDLNKPALNEQAVVIEQKQFLNERVVRDAYQILRITFTLVPLIAGIDKFFHFLTNWDQYLSPFAMQALGPSGSHNFLLVGGAIEIIAGIGVFLKPKIFGYIVAAWLVGIVINLLTTGHFYDIALRDIGLAGAAFALGRLAQGMGSTKVTSLR